MEIINKWSIIVSVIILAIIIWLYATKNNSSSSNNSSDSSGCTTNNDCGNTGTCVSGKCICGAGGPCTASQSCVGGVCQTNNCGSNYCTTSQSCVGGVCQTNNCGSNYCTTSQSCVGGVCQTNNCGSNYCTTNQSCVGGVCQTNNCGSNYCTTNQSCVGGVCQTNNCGSNYCTTNQSCEGGVCQTNNCGSNYCPSDHVCADGNTCILKCGTSNPCTSPLTCNSTSFLCECGSAACLSDEYCSSAVECITKCSTSTSCDDTNKTCNTTTGECMCGNAVCESDSYCTTNGECIQKCTVTNPCSNPQTCNLISGQCECNETVCDQGTSCATVDSSSTYGCVAVCGNSSVSCNYGYYCDTSTSTCLASCESNTGGAPCGAGTLCTFMGCATTGSCTGGQVQSATGGCIDPTKECFNNCNNDHNYTCVNGACLYKGCSDNNGNSICTDASTPLCMEINGSASCVSTSEYCFPICPSAAYACLNNTCIPIAKQCPVDGCKSGEICYNGGCIPSTSTCASYPGLCGGGDYCDSSTNSCVSQTKCETQSDCTNSVCADGFCREECTYGATLADSKICSESGSICVSARQYLNDSSMAATTGFCATPYSGNMYFTHLHDNNICFSDEDCSTNYYKCDITTLSCYNSNLSNQDVDYNAVLDPNNYQYEWISLNVDTSVECGAGPYTVSDTVPISCLIDDNNVVPIVANVVDYQLVTSNGQIFTAWPVVFELDDITTDSCPLKNLPIPGFYSNSTLAGSAPISNGFNTMSFNSGDQTGAMGIMSSNSAATDDKAWYTWDKDGIQDANHSSTNPFECKVLSASYLHNNTSGSNIWGGPIDTSIAPNTLPLLWYKGTNISMCAENTYTFFCINPVESSSTTTAYNNLGSTRNGPINYNSNSPSGERNRQSYIYANTNGYTLTSQ